MLIRRTNVKNKQYSLNVLKYIVESNIEYNVNNNCVLFNMTVLSDASIQDIDNILPAVFGRAWWIATPYME